MVLREGEEINDPVLHPKVPIGLILGLLGIDPLGFAAEESRDTSDRGTARFAST